MKKAYSVSNILKAKFKTLNFDNIWTSAIGHPELTGSWMIYGAPKHGKTSFAMQLSKYLTQFERVAYNSVEEGLSLTIQRALERTMMEEVNGRFVLLNKESIVDVANRLERHKSPNVVVIDSVQFSEMTFSDYKMLKGRFPHKLFIYVSHIQGTTPEGRVARRIWRDANVYFRVEGFRAFPVSRYGGGTPIDIYTEKAEKYWELKLKSNSYENNI